jgi:hypothetical protein
MEWNPCTDPVNGSDSPSAVATLRRAGPFARQALRTNSAPALSLRIARCPALRAPALAHGAREIGRDARRAASLPHA